MTIQSSIQIGEVIRNAYFFNVNNWRDRMNPDSLLQSVQDLFALLEERKIEYVLVGGIALLNYIEGRNTQDLDLIMTSTSLEILPELLVSSKDGNFARADYNRLQIDIFLTQNSLFRTVQRKYFKVQQLLDRKIPIATVEGLLLLKLFALPSLYRQGNFSSVGIYENDVAALLHYYQPDLALLLAELSKYLSESDYSEIEKTVSDIQKRIERFKNGSG